MLMDYTDVGRTRIGETSTAFLLFDVTHVAYGMSGFNPGTPGTPLPLNPAATGLTSEVFRKEISNDSIITESYGATTHDDTVWSTVGGDEFVSTLGEAGLIATITDAGTSGQTVGDQFLLAHTHFGRIVHSAQSRLSIPWRMTLNLPVAPVQLGGFVTGTTLQTDATVSGRIDAAAATPLNGVTLTAPAAARRYGVINHYTPDQELSWSRTLLMPTSAADVNLMEIKVDYDRDAVYGTFIADTSASTVQIRDEAGSTLHIFNKAAGTHSVWGGWFALRLSTGAVLWGNAVNYDAPPVNSFQQTRPCHVDMLGTRLYIAGMTRINVAYPQLPTFSGATYPGTIPTAGWAGGLWLCEIDPLTGNGINITTNANPGGAVSGARPISTGTTIAESHLITDSVNDRVHVTGGYTGPLNDKEIIIGEGTPSQFSTRDFAYWGAGNSDGKPFLATFNADLEAQVASTVALDNITTIANNSPAVVGRPAILPSGGIIWPWQNVGTAHISTVGSDIDRSGGGGSYGTDACAEFTGGQLSMVRVSAAHDSPDWNVSLANYPGLAGARTKEIFSHVHPDGDVIISNLISRGSTGVGETVSILSTPLVTQTPYQTWTIGQNPATGALLWQARVSPNTVLGFASSRDMFTWDAGPNAGVTVSVGMYRPTVYLAEPHGVNDPGAAGPLAYDVNDKWVSNVAASMCFVLVARDKAGNTLPGICMPMMTTASGSAFNSFPAGIEGY